jgi:hypothetical protein
MILIKGRRKLGSLATEKWKYADRAPKHTMGAQFQNMDLITIEKVHKKFIRIIYKRYSHRERGEGNL